MERDYPLEIARYFTKNPNEFLWKRYWSYHTKRILLIDLAYSAIKMHENTNNSIDLCLEKVLDYYRKHKKLIPQEYLKGEK